MGRKVRKRIARKIGLKLRKKYKCACCGANSHRGLCELCAFGKCPKKKSH